MLNSILDKFQDYLNNFFVFKTTQSKLAILFGIISILISASDGLKLFELLAHFFSFYFIAKNIDCLVYGGCISKSWFVLVIPLFGIILSVLYRLSYFDKYNNKIKDKINQINYVNHRNNNPLFNIKKNKNLNTNYENKNQKK